MLCAQLLFQSFCNIELAKQKREFLTSTEVEDQGWLRDIVDGSGKLLTFEEFSEKVTRVDMLRSNSTRASNYAYLLERWFSMFDRKNILVLSYDEVQNNPDKAQWRVRQFLGAHIPGELPRANTKENSTKSVKKISPRVKKILGPLFVKKNEALYRLLEKHKGPWMEQRPFPRFQEDYLLNSTVVR